ncbi:MAG: hypothetical protein GXP35_09265 [Actinobacteria bacterium]|nr:hypothetical protein [Actinomycetota bacterium]
MSYRLTKEPTPCGALSDRSKAGASGLRLRWFAAALVLTLAACSSASEGDPADGNGSSGADSPTSNPSPSSPSDEADSPSPDDTALPTSTPTDTVAPETTTPPAPVDIPFFDETLIHSISVTFDQDDYETMIQTYVDSSEKDWIEATVEIDGVSYEEVGMRLKGNSSLFSLANGSDNPGRQDLPSDLRVECLPPGFPIDILTAGPPGLDASADEPEALPWLIRLDKFVDDQSHGGLHDIVLRANSSATALNEIMALELLDAAGLASQAAVSTTFTVNGSTTTLRLAVENPDDVWMQAAFGPDGALFKANSDGNYDYRGDDPDAYKGIFNQKAGKDTVGFAPLTDFLEFINSADDVTFATDLGDWLETDHFATYLATQELIDNFDDIDGPGNNSYLYYDSATERFTVVPWDMNLAYSGLGDLFGPGGIFDLTPDPNAEPIPGCEDFADADVPLPGFGSNVLADRFQATAEFNSLYEDRLAELIASMYGTGLAADILALRVAVLAENATEWVSETTISAEADGVASFFTAGL